MTSRSHKFVLFIWVLFLVVVSVTSGGCSHKSSVDPSSPSSAPSSDVNSPATPIQTKEKTLPPDPLKGNIDSSGGNIMQASEEQFAKAYENLRQNLSTAFHRLSTVYGSGLYAYDDDEPTERVWGKTQRLLILTSYLDPEIEKQKKYDDNSYGTEALGKIFAKNNRDYVQSKIARLRFKPQNTECESDDPLHRFASITPSGEVCIWVYGVRLTPPEYLEIQLTAIVAHEVGHVLLLSEEEVQQIQRSLFSYPALALNKNQAVNDLRYGFQYEIGNRRHNAEIFTKLQLQYSSDRLIDLCKNFAKYNASVYSNYDFWRDLHRQESEESELIEYGDRFKVLFFSDLFFEANKIPFPTDGLLVSQFSSLCEQTKDFNNPRVIDRFKPTFQAIVASLLAEEAQLRSLNQTFEDAVQPFTRDVSSGNGFSFALWVSALGAGKLEKTTDTKWARMVTKTRCSVWQNGVGLSLVEDPTPVFDPGYEYQGYVEVPDISGKSARLKVEMKQRRKIAGERTPAKFDPTVEVYVTTHEVYNWLMIDDEHWNVREKRGIVNIGPGAVARGTIIPDIKNDFKIEFDRVRAQNLYRPQVVTDNLGIHCYYH